MTATPRTARASTPAAILPGALSALFLLFALASASAGDLRPTDAEQVSAAATARDVASLVADARADLAAAAGNPSDGATIQRAFDRAWNESDPDRREAMLAVWLREWVGPEPAGEPEPSTLEQLLDFRPKVRVVHHEHPGRTTAAFHVAAHARNRIREQSIRSQARQIGDDPGAIRKALSAPADSSTFRAGLRAAVRAPDVVRNQLDLSADSSPSKNHSRSGAATLALFDQGLLGADHLLDVIREAPASDAVQAVRRLRGVAPATRQQGLAIALDRPELGGLPVSMAAASASPALHPRIWALLDDPARGADAALALAQSAIALEPRIAAAFDDARPRERMRMLLALKLRDSAASRELLAQLCRQRLTPAEVRATEAWR